MVDGREERWVKRIEVVMLALGLVVAGALAHQANVISNRLQLLEHQQADLEQESAELDGALDLARSFVAGYFAADCEAKSERIGFPLRRWFGAAEDRVPRTRDDILRLCRDASDSPGGHRATRVLQDVAVSTTGIDGEHIITAKLHHDDSDGDLEVNQVAVLNVMLESRPSGWEAGGRSELGRPTEMDDLRLVSITEVGCNMNGRATTC